MPEDEKQGRSTWTNVAAVVGAVAALITAVVGAVAVLSDGDDGGGGGETPTETRGGPTRAEWVRQATRLCERFRDETAGLSRVDPADAQAAISVLEQGAAVIRNVSDDLSGIPAPPGDEADIQELISIADQEAQAADLMAGAIRTQDAPTFQQHLAEAQTLERRENSLWRSLGVRGCAT